MAQQGRMGILARVFGLAAALGLAGLVAGCAEEYDQSSPEAVLLSARLMVERGEAERLTELVHADRPEMRGLLERVGATLGALQDLAMEVRRAFPEEVESLRREAERAAQEGRATGWLARLRPQRGRGEDQREGFNGAMRALFADPYGWLEGNADRLTTTYLTDESAAILVDGQPVLPPVGMVMVLDGGKWYVALPTNLPGVSRLMPRTPEGFEIIGHLFGAFEVALTELREEVERGEVSNLDELAGRAGDKLFVPIALVFVAYERAAEAARERK